MILAFCIVLAGCVSNPMPKPKPNVRYVDPEFVYIVQSPPTNNFIDQISYKSFQCLTNSPGYDEAIEYFQKRAAMEGCNTIYVNPWWSWSAFFGARKWLISANLYYIPPP